MDAADFASALRSIANNAADVVALNALEEPEHIAAALAASDAGRLVLATLPTRRADTTIRRIIEAFPVARQEEVRNELATNLLGVLSQVLIRRRDGPGRLVAYELLVVTSAVANIIRENQLHRVDAAMHTGKRYGMQLLEDHLSSLSQKGRIALEDRLAYSRSANEFQCDIEDGIQRRLGPDEEDPGVGPDPDDDDGGLGGPVPARPKPPRDDASGHAEPQPED